MKCIVVTVVSLSLLFSSCDEIDLSDLNFGLTEAEISEGLKEALDTGLSSSVASASGTDGYLKNELIKLILPEEVTSLQNEIQTGSVSLLGVNVISYQGLLDLYVASSDKIDTDPFDELVTAMNKGAESAASTATPIFTDALTSMSITDALGILQGSETSATDYFKTATSTALIASFKPNITSALGETKALDIYQAIAGFSNYETKVGLTTLKVSDYIGTEIPEDIEGYATEKAIDGLFTLVGEEEKKIRANPLDYASAIIQKVFNSSEAQGN